MNLPEQKLREIINERKSHNKFESKMVGQVVLFPGQSIYSYDVDTNKITKLIFSKTTLEKATFKLPAGQVIVGIDHSMVDTIHHQSYWNPEHLHCIAINEKNASRKFVNLLKKLITKTKQGFLI
jgi:hypothetical protein